MGQEGKTKMWRGMRRDQEGKIKHWRCGGRTSSLGGGRRKWPQTLRSLPSRRHRVDHRLAQLDTWMFSMIKKWKKLSHQLFRCTDVILIIRASIMQSRVNNCKVNKSQLRSFSQANFPEWWLRHTALTNLPRLLRFAKKGAAQAAVLRAHSQNACSCKFMSLLISLLLCLLLYWPTKGKRKFALASLTKFKTKNWLHTEISLNVEKAQGRYKSRKNTETKMQKNSETNKVSLCSRGVCGLLN